MLFSLFCLIEAEKWAEKIEPYVMGWLWFFTENVFSDNDMDMDRFLAGLPSQ